VLRSGTTAGWGVAVVCGAGINCLGIAPDGRHARFLALGRITGDWGGGEDLGHEALFAAARSEDGRGPRTVLETKVPEHFGLGSPLALAEAIHLGRIERGRLLELAPMVLAFAEEDPIAARIVDRQADEVIAFARAAIERLGLAREAVPVVLGGGLMRAGSARLIGAIEDGVRSVAPQADIIVARVPPIVGAALMGLDRLGAGEAAQDRASLELAAAVETADGLTTRRNGDG
jgi:N-acetylglucosamine kinase-like BadF-type ATPase